MSEIGIISTAVTAINAAKGALSLGKEIKNIINKKPSMEVRIAPSQTKEAYYFPPEELNRRYTNKSLYTSLQISNISKEPFSITDIYITDMDGNNNCSHDPHYIIQYGYAKAFSEPIPQGLKIEAGDTKIGSVCIPNINKIQEDASGAVHVKLYIRITTGEIYEHEYKAESYEGENSNGGASIRFVKAPSSKNRPTRTQL